MNEKTKAMVSLLIKDNCSAIKSQRTKDVFLSNPESFRIKMLDDIGQVKKTLNLLNDYNEELFNYVVRLKTKIPDITSQTIFTALYLLYSYNHRTWKALFLLAKEGYFSQIGTLIRMIKETQMLCDGFAIEFNKNLDTNLKKWFSGDFISHSVGRELINEFFKIENNDLSENFDEVQSHIYQVESLDPHSSYISTLQCISPFTEDFDYDGYTNFHRTVSSLKYAVGTMMNCNTSLKFIYLLVLKDNVGYNELSKVLSKYDNLRNRI